VEKASATHKPFPRNPNINVLRIGISYVLFYVLVSYAPPYVGHELKNLLFSKGNVAQSLVFEEL
jgi:hypothetical protein